jgi:hypothetical protein
MDFKLVCELVYLYSFLRIYTFFKIVKNYFDLELEIPDFNLFLGFL